MSESALPLTTQGGAVGAPVDESEADGKRKKLLLAGAGALVLLLVVAVYFLFLKGGSSSDANASGLVAGAHQHTSTAQTQSAAKAPAATSTKTVPSTFNNVFARDPFKPLYVPVPPPAATTTTPATGSTASTTTATTTTASSTSTPVTLVKVFAKSGKKYAQTKVGTTVYTSLVGQTFGGTFQLLAINGSAATYVQGDEQFSLSVGQVVMK